MHAKILMCPCFMRKFHQEDNEYVKKIIHFHCRCKDKHLYFVLFCKDHPFGAHFSSTMEEKKCMCATGLSHKLRQFCLNVRYLLNFKCFKNVWKQFF